MQLGRNFELLDELVTANHILAHQKALDAYGHVSARDHLTPDRYWISRAMPAENVTRDSLIELTLDGEPVSGRESRLFHERAIHGEIYRARPDVMAIVHNHSASLIPFCNSDVPLRPMTGPAFFLGDGPPVFASLDADDSGDLNVVTPMQGRALAGKLGGAAIVLMRCHGAVIVGSTIREMTRRAVVAELNACQQLRAAVLGPVHFLSEREIAHRRNGSRDPDRGWFKWKDEAEQARALREGSVGVYQSSVRD